MEGDGFQLGREVPLCLKWKSGVWGLRRQARFSFHAPPRIGRVG